MGIDGPSSLDGHDDDAASAPWERPPQWNRDDAEATRAADLIARLAGPTPRRRRQRDDGSAVSASDLIAALSDDAAAAADLSDHDVPEVVAVDADEVDSGAIADDSSADVIEGIIVAEDLIAEDTDDAGIIDAGAADEDTSGPDATDQDAIGKVGSVGAASDLTEDSAATVIDVDMSAVTAQAEADSSDFVVAPDVPVTAAQSADDSHITGGLDPFLLAAMSRTTPSREAAAADTGGPGGTGDDSGGSGNGPGGPNNFDGSDNGDDGGAHGGASHHGWVMAGRVMAAVLAVVLLVAAGTEWVIKMRAEAGLAENQISALDPTTEQHAPATAEDAPAPPTEQTAEPEPVSYEAENILIIGTDARHSEEDIALAGRDDSPGGADVAMVAHFSEDRSHVTVVSIPRDMYIPAPTCQAWDGETGTMYEWDFESPYSMWRLTSTYSAGGPKCTVRGVQNISGLHINRVIVIDFSGFTKIVDSLGGITVNACVPVIDRKLGTVLPEAGKQHINGKQALNLVRARKVQGDTESDLARIRRQQKVMSTMLRDATAANVLLNPAKLDNVLQSFVQSVQTDNVTIDNLLDIAQSLGNLNPKRVTFYTLPTTPDPDGVGLHPDDRAEIIWQALRNDKALPGEVTTPPTASTTASPTPVTELVESEVTSKTTRSADLPNRLTVSPHDIDVQVVNVTGRGGVATAVRNKLTPLGYSIPDSALLLPPGQVNEKVTIEFATSNYAAALTVAASFGQATLVPDDSLGSRVRILLGSSYDNAVSSVKVGDKVPAALAKDLKKIVPSVVETVTSTVTSTVVTTPEITSTAPVTDDEAAKLTSINAGAGDCI